jgi:hypothetical protein
VVAGAFAWLAAASCVHRPADPGAHVIGSSPATPTDLEEPMPPTPPGLALELADAAPTLQVDRLPPTPAAALSAAETARLLARVPALPPREAVAFSVRPSSAPPPRTGETVAVPFPADDGGPPPAAPQGPLRVLRATPEGDVAIAAEISVTFDRPMVPLTTAEQADAAVPVTLSPTPEGRWRWVGTRALLFDAPTRLPKATAYTLTLPAGARAADGSALEQPWTHTFRTPPPTLVQAWPTHDSVPLQPVFLLTFDQRVDPAAIAARATLRPEGRSDARGVELATAEALQADPVSRERARSLLPGTWVAVRPTEPLSGDTAYTLEIPAGTPSAEGPLTTPSAQRAAFRTFGPLKVETVRCGWNTCEPLSPVVFEVSNPLAAGDVGAFIAVSPAIPDAIAYTEGARVVVEGAKQPGTTYTFQLLPGIRDVHGQTFAAPVHHTLEVAAPRPAAPWISAVGSSPQIPDPSRPPEARFLVAGMKSARVEVFAVTPDDWGAFAGQSWFDPARRATIGRRLSDETRPMGGDPNIATELTVPLQAGWEQGYRHFVIDVTQPADKESRVGARVWINATHLGVTTVADGDALHVLVTDLRTGEPVRGASVALSGATPAVTDAQGMARFPTAKGDRLVVTSDDDSALWTASGQAWSSDRWGPKPGGVSLTGFLFDDRGLYRPGETVSVKGWLREVDFGVRGDVRAATRAPARVTWQAYDARHGKIGEGSATVDAWGGLDFTVKLPTTPNLGEAFLALTTDTGATFRHAFDIQEFRRPEYEVEVELATPGPFLIGDAIPVAVTASYYAGGALADAPVGWTVQAERASWSPAGWDGFRFGAWEPPWWRWMEGPDDTAESTANFAGRTDPRGAHHLHITAGPSGAVGPWSLKAEATVTDVNRQAITGATRALVHTADRYVGLRPSRPYVAAGQTLDVDVIVTDLDGRAIPGAPITVRLVRRAWERDPRGGWREVDETTLTCAITSDRAPTRCAFQPEGGGLWQLRADVTDAEGRVNVSRSDVWVSGGEPSRAKRVEAEPLTLVPDRDSYAPGDVAKVLVLSPFPTAEAIVTVQRGGMERVERVRVEGGSTTVEIPIEERHIPNLHLGVDLVSVAPTADGVRPALGRGTLRLTVDPAPRTLQVTASTPEAAVTPGATSRVDVAVRDAEGRPVRGAQVALVVVDEAVLALSGYEIPDPIATFYPDRSGGTSSSDSRAWVVLASERSDATPPEASPPGSLRKSARRGDWESGALPPPAASMMFADAAGPPEETGAPIQVRSDFSALALWSPAVETDAQGQASVPFKLPDSLTRYRVVAVAVDRGQQFGRGSASITARLPVMLRPSPPRFLNFGDRAELPLVVQNLTDAPQTVQIAVTASHATFDGAPSVGRKVTVPAQDRVEVRVPVSPTSAGVAAFQAAIATPTFADAVEFELPVYTPATAEAFAVYGVLDGPAGTAALRQPMQVPQDVWPQFGGLEVSTSSTALSALTDALIQIVDYPYGCVEQISSRVLAVAALRDVLTAFHAEGLPDADELDDMIARDVAELERRQRGDGAWGWWYASEGRASPFTTLHATHALVRAREAGMPVPEGALEKGLRRLRHVRDLWDPSWGDAGRHTIEAYAIAVRHLAEEETGDEALALTRAIGPTWTQRLDVAAWLLPALHAEGHTDEVDAALAAWDQRLSETASTAQITTGYGETADAVTLHSARRTDALVLDALLQVAPQHDVLPKLVEGLLGGRVRGHWGSTQEDAWVLLALQRYFRVAEAVTPDLVARAWLGQDAIGEHAFRGRTTETAAIAAPMSWIAEGRASAPITLAREGAGRLYWRLGLRYAPRDLQLEAVEAGFSVRRTYTAVDDPTDVRRDADGTWHIRAGARVRVTVDLVAPGRRYHVALVDPLPAGLEAINPELRTTATDEPAVSDGVDGTSWRWWGPWYTHTNLRDERVEAFAETLWDGVHTFRYLAVATTPGRFVAPPARAEEMYHPETFGRTATDRVIVE